MTSGTDIPLSAPGGDTARELHRPRDNRMVAGVAAGLAEYFGLRPAVYRIAFAALALVGGAGILLYVVAALVIPAEGADESIAEEFLRRHRDRPGLLVGLGIAGVLAISIVSSPGRDWGWPLVGPLSFLLLLGLAGLALWQVSRRDREPRAGVSARPRSLFLPGLGLLLAAAGGIALLHVLDVVDVRYDVVLTLGLVLVGLLIAVGAFFHRTAGLVPLGLLLAAVLAGGALGSLGRGGPIGERSYSPSTVADLRDEYNLRIGRLELDLRDLELPAGETRVELDAGIGEVVVHVPPGILVDATADTGVGEVAVFGEHDDGWDAHVRQTALQPGTEGSDTRLVIDAHVGVGHVEVRPAGL
jgi:phage shock protein PspC (stress-responsive transcriptional regulator)